MNDSDDNGFPREQKAQLFRFCLYGFLKSLQFFEPFLILAFRGKGFSFAAIGVLIAFRAICTNLMEIPSGAIADIWGRRRAMILSMIGYICSFVMFAMAETYWLFFPAMFLFAVGEAFRTGTHKAIIFDWLTRQGRESEKTMVYGLTRSWSKQGAALNCVVAAVIVIITGDYRWVFLMAAVPYAANVVNLLCYPGYLDGSNRDTNSLPSIIRVVKDGFKLSTDRRGLAGLIAENVCFEGFFSVIKDYLQPLIKTAALGLPIFITLKGDTRTAVLVAAVYLVLNQISSLASRQSHRVVKRSGGESMLSKKLWYIVLCVYAIMTAGFLFGVELVAILVFVVMFVLLNIWKPVFVSRFHDKADLESAATTLSIANQSKTLSIAVLAPALGAVVDKLATGIGGESISLHALWPVAVLGFLGAMVGLLINRRVFRRICGQKGEI